MRSSELTAQRRGGKGGRRGGGEVLGFGRHYRFGVVVRTQGKERVGAIASFLSLPELLRPLPRPGTTAPQSCVSWQPQRGMR